jgi:cellulose biosynthesis protein BcsQ
MAVRIAVVADKGGVGRTDLVRLLAETFASQGLSVICGDMDYQAILSRRMGYDMYGHDSDLPSTFDLMQHDVQRGHASKVLTPCRWDTPWADRIQLLPATGQLWDIEQNPGKGNPTGRLVRAMDGVDDDAHVSLWDTRPDMGTNSQAVWALVDYLIGITPADRDGSEGMLRLLSYALDYAPDLDNEELKVAGVVLNEFSPRAQEQQRDHDQLQNGLAQFAPPIPIFERTLPVRTYIRYSASNGMPLETYLSRTSKDREKLKEARAFMNPLAAEIREKIDV